MTSNELAKVTYLDEHQLVTDFVDRLAVQTTPWGPLSLVTEFFYQRGRVDVVGVGSEGTVFAFEAKLTRWRLALQQAYRNTCFAHESYVLLPWDVAQVARQYVTEFERRRVGLCTVCDGNLVILHEAKAAEPLQPWLAKVAFAEATRRSVADASVEF